jgi:putative SOS response-associated peptidase YedK
MPVILEPDTANRWLAGDDELIDYVIQHSPKLRAWPVDRSVNNPRHEGESLIVARGDELAS